MSDLALAVAQTRYALHGLVRQSRVLVFTAAMPVMLLVLFNTIFHSRDTGFAGRQVPEASFYTASMISYEVMITASARSSSRSPPPARRGC